MRMESLNEAMVEIYEKVNSPEYSCCGERTGRKDG